MYNCQVVEIICKNEADVEYTIKAYLLEDGRLLTLGTGEDGVDSLWSRVDDYEPQGYDTFVNFTLTEEFEEIPLSFLISADKNNRDYNSSVLTNKEWSDRDFPRTYYFEVEGNCSEIIASSEEEAIETASSDAVENWDTADSSIIVSWYLNDIDKNGNHFSIASDTVAIHPDEPKCEHIEGHDWRSPYSLVGGDKSNPGVIGNGGGVIITQVCVRCGCEKVTDTWAQSSTGEQGFESVSYQVGKHEINNDFEAIRWDGDIGKWCDRWFCRRVSFSFDTEKEAIDEQYDAIALTNRVL